MNETLLILFWSSYSGLLISPAIGLDDAGLPTLCISMEPLTLAGGGPVSAGDQETQQQQQQQPLSMALVTPLPALMYLGGAPVSGSGLTSGTSTVVHRLDQELQPTAGGAYLPMGQGALKPTMDLLGHTSATDQVWDKSEVGDHSAQVREHASGAR